MTSPLFGATHEQMLEQHLREADKLFNILDAADAEESLEEYGAFMWSVLEPGRVLVRGWVLSAICEHLVAVTNGELKKLLINVPPGFMKSLLSNVIWPSWEWGPQRRPWLRYFSASYNAALTIRDNRRCRSLIESPLYQRLWGPPAGWDPKDPVNADKAVDWVQLTGDQNNKIKFENTAKGWKFATSVGGVGTGERGDRLIIDDPHSVSEAESENVREGALQWFTETLTTRKNDEDSPVVVIMQRVHERDVSGLILAEELGYEHLCVPMEYESDHPYAGIETKGKSAIGWVDPRHYVFEETKQEGMLAWEERCNLQQLAEKKKDLGAWGGTYAQDGQLQQTPSPRGGGFIKEEWLEIVDMIPPGGLWWRVWDIAGSERKRSPYTVGVLGKLCPLDNCWYVKNVIRERTEDPEQLIEDTAKIDGKKVRIRFPQDPGSAGKTQRRAIGKRLKGYIFYSTRNTGDKITRSRPMVAQMRSGNWKLLRANWNKEYINELKKVPAGRYMDQLDASSDFFDATMGKGMEELRPAAPEMFARKPDEEF